MNKADGGKSPAKEPSEKNYQKALQHNCARFATALRQYPEAAGDDRKRLANVMDEQLKLIHSDVSELKRVGISKEAVQLEKAFKAYMLNDSSQNLAAVEHNLSTLCEFNC